MPQVDPLALGKRLSKEMARSKLTLEGFRLAVENRSGHARGTSYGSIWSYVNGQGSAEPRRELIEAMADVLGVLPDYLLTGRGPRTKEDAAMQEAGLYVDERRDDEDIKRWRIVYRAISAAESKLPYLATTSFEGTRDAILEDLTMAFFRSGRLPLDGYTNGQFVEAVFLLAWLLTLPAAVFGPSTDIGEGYFMAMGSALATLVRQEASPVDTLAKLRTAKKAWEAAYQPPLDPEQAALMEVLEEMSPTFEELIGAPAADPVPVRHDHAV